MLGRVGILPVPAALEVELSTNTTRARHGWEEVMLGANAAEIQTEVRNGLLLETSHRRRHGVVPGDHTEVVGEDGRLSRLVREEVVNDSVALNELKAAVRIVKVQLRKPVCRLVLLNATGGTFRLPKVIRRRDLNSEVGTANDSVDVSRDLVWVYDGVSTFNDKDARAHKEVSGCGRCESEEGESESDHNEGRSGSG